MESPDQLRIRELEQKLKESKDLLKKQAALVNEQGRRILFLERIVPAVAKEDASLAQETVITGSGRASDVARKAQVLLGSKSPGIGARKRCQCCGAILPRNSNQAHRSRGATRPREDSRPPVAWRAYPNYLDRWKAGLFNDEDDN